MLEIRFHGRGGQGAVTAANLLASAALKDGHKGVQSFPFFGGERRGAPVKAFARISDGEIHLRSQIYHPDIVVVLDAHMIESTDVTAGMDQDSVLIVNTTQKPTHVAFSKQFKVATVDAARVSIRHGLLVAGIPIINTPILGAIPRVSKVVSLESIQDAIREQWKGKPGEENAQAARDAYELTEVNFS